MMGHSCFVVAVVVVGIDDIRDEKEWFLFECREVIDLICISYMYAPLFHPIRTKTKGNCTCNSIALLFPHVT